MVMQANLLSDFCAHFWEMWCRLAVFIIMMLFIVSIMSLFLLLQILRMTCLIVFPFQYQNADVVYWRLVVGVFSSKNIVINNNVY